ncbi:MULTISPECIES: peptidoglycan D,D-transpeptidase FtsI family protein [Paenibacillus]|uniref:Penicillin-binding protein n=1 Tax=Paenibacillus campinasensis TaxID=66347 RepID=A0A268F5B0_9BACL|nr:MULTISPECIES: penicillin-binding transpeptidase domain-containing protein [Paenibacillus]PAD80566.1 penicillin-binding protein [Paenibacillus campinasensis]PAK55164.1 penicillin-binding protein [Paenibacillus sp. 7541]
MKLDRKQRVVYGWLILTLFILILAGRLAWVQLVMKHQRMPGSNHTMIEASLYQRERGVVLDSGRGHFTDRYGQPLTGHLIWTAVLFPMNKAEWSEAQPKLRQLSDILNTDYDALTDQWHKSHEPILWHAQSSPVPTALSSEQIARIHELELEYIQVLPYQQRYPAGLSGMQWLGYVSGQRKENLFYKDDPEIKGNSGLEKALDPIIRGDEPTIVYFPVNGGNHVIQDMEPMVKASSNPYYPLRVQSTIDAGMQQAIEDLTEKANMGKGAVVVLDARNADILAMVSRPFYNPEDIHPEAGEWENRAVKAAVPGSIFKLVTAAAALEHGVVKPREKFHCSGEYGKYGLSCWKEGGHGTITAEEGFAHSCNVVFATLAERLTHEQLEAAANSLGLGQTVGWQAKDLLGLSVLKPLDHEEQGTIFDKSADRSDAGERVQTAIGQRDTAISPLQAANMVVTLLHGGEVHRPRLMDKLTYANGQLLYEAKPVVMGKLGGNGNISRETSAILRKWMEDVVREGTGKSLLNHKARWAGKSGTAQVKVKGRARNNQWFIGYGPVEQPRYAVAVLVEDRSPDSSHQATQLFGQVIDLLASPDFSVSGSGSAR